VKLRKPAERKPQNRYVPHLIKQISLVSSVFLSLPKFSYFYLPNHFMKKLLLPFLLIAILQNLNAQVCFAPPVNFPVGNGPKIIECADFNNDGKPDVATANQNSNDITVRLGNGTGGFSTPANFGAGSSPQSIISADFNNDSKLDLAVCNYGGNNVSVLLGDGAGSFSAPVNFGVGNSPISIKSGDFNGDANADLVVANYLGNNVTVIMGDGSGTFGIGTNFNVGTGPSCIVIKDLDGDTDKDLAVTNYNSNDVSILLGAGTGSFGTATNFTVGTAPQAITSLDLDGDADMDLLVANASSNSISVLGGDGLGGFGSPNNYPTGSAPYSIVNADFNSDSNMDMAVCNYSTNDVYIFTGNGNGTFNTPSMFPTGTAPYSIVSADLNNDTKADLVTANTSSNDISVLLFGLLTASAGTDQTVCENNAAVSLSGSSSTGSGVWSTSGTGIFNPTNTTLTCNYIPSTADILVGSVMLTLTTTNNGACTSAQDNMNVTITAAPSVTAGPDNIMCTMSPTVSLFGNSSTGSATWSTSGTGTFTPNNTVLTPDYMASAQDQSTGVIILVITSGNNGNCLAVTDTAVLVIRSDTLSGMITDTSNNPVTAGIVYVFKQDYSLGRMDTLGYGIINAGTYFLSCLDTGLFIIKAIADTTAYPSSVPTYYAINPGAYQWDSATVVTMNSYGVNLVRNIKIIQLPATTGPGIITGQIVEGPGFGSRIGNGAQIMGAPLKGVDVKLGKNPGGTAAARTTTDNSGNFTFTNVPLGSYRIFVDVPSYPMDSIRSITLTSGSSTSSDNDYFIDSMMVYVDSVGLGIDPISGMVNKFSLYPNPSSGKFYVELSNSEKMEVQILDRQGRLVLSQAVSGKASVDASVLSDGFYTLSIRSSEGVIHRKLVIVR